MKRTGFINLHRSVWDHELFKRERFTRREAWLWMCSAAEWRTDQEIPRGSFQISTREMARAWGWDAKQVRRFLTLCMHEEMLEKGVPSSVPTSVPTYLVVNYDTYAAPVPSSVPSKVPTYYKKEEVKKGLGAPTSPSGNIPTLRGSGAVPSLEELGLDDATAKLVPVVAGFVAAVSGKPRWPLSEPIEKWTDRLRRNTKYAGVPLEEEILRAQAWHEAKGLKRKAATNALLNWLDKAAEIGKRNTNGEDQWKAWLDQ